MLLEITEKIIGENAFEQKKKKPQLNLTLGWALIGLWTTETRASCVACCYKATYEQLYAKQPGLWVEARLAVALFW